MSRAARIWIRADGADLEALGHAVREAGGALVEPADANAFVWAAENRAEITGALHRAVEWVHVWDAGVDGWLETGAVDGTRVWTASKAAYGEPIAEYCLAALLAAARRLPTVLRARTWSPVDVATLAGATLGIVGAGGIGRALLRLLEPFGTETIALTRRGLVVPGASSSVGPEGLDELLAASDYVVLALPATPDTIGLLSAERLARMRPGAWLVNVGRGDLVDTEALVDAIRGGRLGGAVLDVTDPEPLPDDHPLWRLDNVAITSHTAGTADLCRSALAERVRDNVQRFRAGQPLLGVVDLDRGY